MNHQKLAQRVLSILGLAILAVFIYKTDVDSISQSLENISFSMIIMILALTASHIFVKAFRWKALIYKISGDKISLRFSFLSIIAGVAFGSITPGRIEMAKPIMLKERNDVPISSSLPGVFMERICDFFAISSIILISLLFIPSQKIISGSFLLTALVVVFMVASCLALFFPGRYHLFGKFVIKKIPLPRNLREKLDDFLEKFFTTFKVLKNKNLLSFLLIFSTLAIILEVLQFHLILRFFGVNSSLALSAFVFTSTTILGVLSMIPGGTGVIEVSSVAILAVFISGSEAAIQGSVLLNRIISYYLLILLGSLIMLFYKRIFKNS